MNRTRPSWPKRIAIFLFAVFFAGACFYHFKEAEGFARMLPEFVPLRVPIIYATGILELVLAVLLLVPSLRRKTGVIIAVYLVLVFPANIYAALYHIPAPSQSYTPPSLLWLRLLFQPLLIWWVLWASSEPAADNPRLEELPAKKLFM
ncbi:hypothetical protein [Paenibacillus sp. UNC499MF]|uniref:DoxX family protein n=1 Tax=Paenibacillus sp. UNC499MF TaxID=1502751 RepID=UPI00089FE458|nr:hypothetical protein [Paenibacillus sp. UNC499MF]SEG67398.1 Uncharacterized membrane protein [Paenibacillus sp. UNC499MF]